MKVIEFIKKYRIYFYIAILIILYLLLTGCQGSTPPQPSGPGC